MDKQSMVHSETTFISDVVGIVRKGRDSAYSAVNISMLDTYWNIGRRIVLEEQCGEQRAEYGAQLLKTLSKVLTVEFGKGFSERNFA